ncbi:pyrroline-5-carboxylate reductase [Negativicoccus succinicivorans]|uniref:Pyrroline-5-carboxylate reductase n=1 Tax=Negativicoccus succinicivorans TaxID=620903 RepID=A0A841R2D0_9FIRM|nr:pyrroline-5-carboxylate reductase [Negativicoccus succinicivorans]MBB6478045.1 pyrroline-5-carboxylate reductase [Negativicoccus succinicivorans]MDU1056330.1 pyrroline-5-carboxylate reductase [Negativicoccus succinicivorans]MDU5657220.1 pyrroline-5-carboxylate reductase [Negativicoccus succinicivorans]
MTKLGIIGVGAMGGAILRGILAGKVVATNDVYVREHTPVKTQEVAERYGVNKADWSTLATCDVVIIAVKPYKVKEVLSELAAAKSQGVIVSIAAGTTLAKLHEWGTTNLSVIRVMPNTPVDVAAGMISIAPSDDVAKDDVALVESIFAALGETVVVSEAELTAMMALAGAGPAYVYVIMDALADAGVRIGLPRKLAIKAAAQTLFGAAKMQLTSNTHPAILRDQVTSPGGTTIAGIQAMERNGLRAALIEGVVACYERDRELAQTHE